MKKYLIFLYIIAQLFIVSMYALQVYAADSHEELTLQPRLQGNSLVSQGKSATQIPPAGSQPAPGGDAQIHDIYPPIPLPSPPSVWSIVTIVSLFLLAGAAVYYLLRRKKRIPLPVTSPEDRALNDLAKVHLLYDERQYAHYAAELSSILRTYLEEKFHVFSTRRTSSELLESLRRMGNPSFMSNKELITELLQQADMAKFALHTPAPKTLLAFESGLIELIRSNRSAENSQGERP